LITVVAIAACAMLGTSQAQASLDLTVTNETGGSLVAITPTSDYIQINLWATVNGLGSNNAINRIFYSIYSTNVTNPLTNLTKVDVLNSVDYAAGTWNTDTVWQPKSPTGYKFAPFTYNGQPVGTATRSPTSQDLDGDTDLDAGSTHPNAEDGGRFWGGFDLDQKKSYQPIDSLGHSTGPETILFYWTPSSSIQFGTAYLDLTPYAAGTMGHGITQIYMTGKPNESYWREDGQVVGSGTPSTGAPLTLYRAAEAHNSSLEMTINQTSSGTLDGSASVGTIDHWI